MEPLNSESSPLESERQEPQPMESERQEPQSSPLESERQEPSNQEPSNQEPSSQEPSNPSSESRSPPPKQSCYPSRQALRSKTTCQHCDATLSYHTLIYKHKCPQASISHEARVNRSLEKLKERAAKLAEQQLVVAN